MAPGCERSRPVVAGPGGAYAVALRSMHGGLVPRLLCPVSRLPRPVPAFPVFCCPRPVARVLRSASFVLHPVPPCPCPRPRPRPRVPRFASCAPRPRLPCSAPAPRAPHPRPRCPALCARGPAPASPAPRARAPVFCVPQTVARVPRPISPPHTSGRLLPASARCRDEKKIGRFPTGTSRFCMHCSGASYSRLRIISPPW